jgi:DNA invertase Pin-like site-specific DNA recombinase
LSSLSVPYRHDPANFADIPQPRQRRKRRAASPAAQSRATLYVRVSTEAQTEDTGSLESQETACRALYAARGYEVARLFIGAGQSGGTLDRPALAQLREAVASGEVGVVVVYALDRLSRSQKDTLALLEEFEQHGVGLTAASQSFDTTTPAGRAMLGMLAVFAELQRAEIRERTRSALRGKRERGEESAACSTGSCATARATRPTLPVGPRWWPASCASGRGRVVPGHRRRAQRGRRANRDRLSAGAAYSRRWPWTLACGDRGEALPEPPTS